MPLEDRYCWYDTQGHSRECSRDRHAGLEQMGASCRPTHTGDSSSEGVELEAAEQSGGMAGVILARGGDVRATPHMDEKITRLRKEASV